jgi:anaerobic ribonucleoside-triphosphate reductase activating protein
MQSVRLHSFLPYSLANGPGTRAVVWVQGCSLACPGCFNPETHASRGGTQTRVDELYCSIRDLGDTIEGITISGGEPLQQLPSIATLLHLVRSGTNLSSLVFTGYSWDELQKMRGIGSLLAAVDILIAGRFDSHQRLAHGLRGSANKTVHLLSDRYTLSSLALVPEAEVVICPDGSVTCTGIDPLAYSQ